MSIKDIKSVDKLQNMLKTAIDENKYLKKCCEKVGNELAKNSFEYDGKEKNLIVQAMVLNEAIETRERALKDIKEIAKISIEIIQTDTSDTGLNKTCFYIINKNILSTIEEVSVNKCI